MNTPLPPKTSITLEYDRGSIIVSGLSPYLAEVYNDLVLWDERVHVWRAPAHRYGRLVRRLRSQSASYTDRVRKVAKPGGHWTTVGLRTYQEVALQSWRAAQGQGLVCLPTGAGKTRLAIAAMQRTAKATLCLVPTRVLLHQWVEAIREFYDGDVGILGDGFYEIRPITVATFASAFRFGWVIGNNFELLIVDEAHHFGAGEQDEALEACSAPFRLGLSATLDACKQTQLNELIGPKIYEQQIDDLIGSALAAFDLACIHLPLTAGERRLYEADYHSFKDFFEAYRLVNPLAPWNEFVKFAYKTPKGRLAMAGLLRSRRALAFTHGKRVMLCNLLNKHREQRKLVFTADAATALTIARQLLIAPIVATITKHERDRLLQDFKDGSLRTLVACKVLNEGFDVPNAEVAIIVGGSGSDREHIQRVGRVLRPAPGKRAQIYELLAACTLEVQQSRRRGRMFRGRRQNQYY